MQLKRILFTVWLMMLSVMGLSLFGCSADNDAATAMAAIESLPFPMPDRFSYSAEATARNDMLTFVSNDQTTLIISCTDANEDFLNAARSQTITAAALTASYKEAGLDVSIDKLDKQSTADKLLYTYTVHLPSLSGNTVTRKYIRITKSQILDLSCGGSAENSDTIDGDYNAVIQAIEAAEPPEKGLLEPNSELKLTGITSGLISELGEE